MALLILKTFKLRRLLSSIPKVLPPLPYPLIPLRSLSSNSCTTPNVKTMASTTKILPEITRSGQDTRDYRGLELGNKLKVLLISDPSTDISAAAISVAAGSMHDPPTLLGLAHFCEHMLFLGTSKYPEENEYSKFLAENGGGSNAYTAQDHTCYYFDVGPDSLLPALDRFSQFFITPLFTESGTEREVNAVNSEHQKNIPHDSWRVHQLAVHLADPTHPYSKFATGNIDTLWNVPRSKNLDVREALLKYYSACYSSNLMGLTVFGKEDLDELQGIVEDLFSDIENKNLELPRWTQSPYGPAQLGTRVNAVPIMDIRHLQIEFPIPDPTPTYRARAEHYLSHLIGHEGPGSLLSLLKKKHWVNNLSAGGMTVARGTGMFKILVDLTESGMSHTDEIILHVFQYLELLRLSGPQKWIWDETRNMASVTFEYQDKQRPQSLVSGCSAMLHDIPVQDVLSHGVNVAEYDPDLITEILDMFKPENSLVICTSKLYESEVNMTEPYYGVKYTKAKISQELIDKWTHPTVPEELSLPEPNPLIPTKFELKERDDNTSIIPKLLVDTPMSRVWYLQDNEFSLPKGVLRMELYSPSAYSSPLACNLNQLFRDALKDILTENSYAALLAELGYDINNSSYGLDIVLKGYDHKLDVLLDMIMDAIVGFTIAQPRFDVLKDTLTRGLRNWADEQPYQHAIFYFEYLLRERKFSAQEQLAALDEVTLDALKDFVSQFTKTLKFEFLITGNFTGTEAMNLVEQVEGRFVKTLNTVPVPKEQIKRYRETQIPAGSNLVYELPHQSHLSSCTGTLFQTGTQSTRKNVTLELINSIAAEPFFNQLRTQEQLGYIVTCGVRRANGTQGIKFLVQSDKHPAYVDGRIEEFVTQFSDFLQNMSEEDFLQHRTSLVVRKSEKPKKITERALILWSEIASQQYNFDRQAVEVDELETLTKEDIIEFFEENIGANCESRKRLSVHITATQGAGKEPHPLDDKQVIIPSALDWKSGLEFYPLPAVPVPTLPPPKKSKL